MILMVMVMMVTTVTFGDFRLGAARLYLLALDVAVTTGGRLFRGARCAAARAARRAHFAALYVGRRVVAVGAAARILRSVAAAVAVVE